MAKTNSNWVKLNRSIFDNELWLRNEPFDYRSAWVDLILLANHEDGNVVVMGEVIKVPRGSHFTSAQHLANRWHWSRKKVRAYLNVLFELGMVVLWGTHRGTLISLVKYDDYQGRGPAEDTSEGTPEGTSEGTQTRIEEYKNKRSTHQPTKMEETIAFLNRWAQQGEAEEL